MHLITHECSIVNSTLSKGAYFLNTRQELVVIIDSAANIHHSSYHMFWVLTYMYFANFVYLWT